MAALPPGGNVSLFETLRGRIFAAITHLPYIIITFVGFLMIGLGNIGLFILFMGHAIIVPALVVFLTTIVRSIPGISALFDVVPPTNLNNVIPDGRADVSVTPTYWSAHMTFFFGYLLANAVGIYTTPLDPLVDKNHYNNRIRRIRNNIILITLLGLAMPIMRYRLTGLETIAGIVLTWIAFGGIGYAWYQFAESCGARTADVFGIAQQMIPASAKDETPMACVYSPKP